MAVQHFEETVVYPSVRVITGPETISKILLGEDIADMFGCIVNFEVGEKIDAFNELSVFKHAENEYMLVGHDSHIERYAVDRNVVYQVPADLHSAIKLLDKDEAYYVFVD